MLIAYETGDKMKENRLGENTKGKNKYEKLRIF